MIVYSILIMEADEEFARKLQEEFNREARELEIQNETDACLAQKLATESHTVSDSENEDDLNDKSEAEVSILEKHIRESIQCDDDNIPSSNVSSTSDAWSKEGDQQKKGMKRPVCQYGADCFRKNPVHLSEFYHPEKSASTKSASTTNDDAGEGKRKRNKGEQSTLFKHKDNYSGKSFDERLSLSQPYRFFLNKIYSIPETVKDWQTLVFPDLLNPKLGTIIESAQLNFMVDLDFVMKFYKSFGVAKTPVLFMYGQMEGDPKDYEGVTCNKVRMPFQYGVHHTKMMIFHYKEGLRVVVHTANLIPDDWNEKTQGFWISPLFPPLDDGRKTLLEGESKTCFKRDLVDYLLSYGKPDLVRWSHIVKGHDFSTCSVYFIGSVPGYYVGEKKSKFGHMKCRNLIRKWSKWKPQSSLPTIIQCSSIGSLGSDPKSWLVRELGSSLSGGYDVTNASVNLIYPSKEDVRNSCQGYGGGSCLPYNSKTHEKQLWLMRHLCSWRSKDRQRTGSMPHIKTYTRLSRDRKEAQFFLLTSSNLSKAAWGTLQKQETQLFIRSYEAGVLWLPEHVVGTDSFPLTGNEDIGYLKLPYDLPLTPYPSDEIPWFMDTHKNTPDIFGNLYP